MSDLYETDVVAWSEAQAALLRRLASGEAVNDQVDWEHIVDEVETVGRSERAAVRSHIAAVPEHLVKLLASPAIEPRNGWKASIDRARIDIERLLKDSPSPRRELAGMIREETKPTARLVSTTLRRYGEQPRIELSGVTFTGAQVLGEWFPDDPS